MQVFSGINVTQMTAWTKDILGRGVRDEADRQILRAAVYRHGESRLIVEEALAGGSIEAIATNVPLLRAYLETSAVVAASPHRALALDRAFEALVAMLETVANQQDTTRFEDLIISLQLVLDARPALLLAVRDKLVIIILTLAPSHLEAIIFRTIDQLCNQHQGLAPVLAAFVDRCMLWLVRRYAEDAEDGKQVVALADEMGASRFLLRLLALKCPQLERLVSLRRSEGYRRSWLIRSSKPSYRIDSSTLRLSRSPSLWCYFQTVACVWLSRCSHWTLTLLRNRPVFASSASSRPTQN